MRATVKQHLAATGCSSTGSSSIRPCPSTPRARSGDRTTSKAGKTPVLTTKETRSLLDGFDITNLVGLRDRAFLGVLVYGFARVSAAARSGSHASHQHQR